MRFAAYIIAVLVAAGLIFVISQSSNEPSSEATQTASAETSAADASVENNATEGTLVSLRVPDMHCPFACYPAVKKTLEQEPGVLAVDLAEQKVDGTIDNPVVVVKVADGFSAEAAINALAKAGFDESTKVQ